MVKGALGVSEDSRMVEFCCRRRKNNEMYAVAEGFVHNVNICTHTHTHTHTHTQTHTVNRRVQFLTLLHVSAVYRHYQGK